MQKSSENFIKWLNKIKEFNPSTDKVVIFLIVIGLFLRLSVYLKNISLHLDELSVALLLRDHSFFDLILPFRLLTESNSYVYHTVTAPLGFLLFIKTLIVFLGNSELILRLLPFTAGLLSFLLSTIILFCFFCMILLGIGILKLRKWSWRGNLFVCPFFSVCI